MLTMMIFGKYILTQHIEFLHVSIFFSAHKLRMKADESWYRQEFVWKLFWLSLLIIKTEGWELMIDDTQQFKWG